MKDENTALHPLHTPEWVARYVLNAGEYPGERCTGRTTAIALRALSDAINNPGEVIVLRDHVQLTTADDHLTKVTQDMADRLGLKGLTFQRNPGRVVFGTPRDDRPVGRVPPRCGSRCRP